MKAEKRLAETSIAHPRDDLCLAFANTRYWRGGPEPTEDLRGIEDLLSWAERNAGVEPGFVGRLRAGLRGPEADRAYGRAIALREAIYRLFAATASGDAVAPKDLEALNDVLHKAPSRLTLRQVAGGYAWEAWSAGDSVAALLAGVAWSTADLLAGSRLVRVRQCANERCRWLFLDDSKSSNRRWCAMSACGNRAKAQRHYARHKAS